jgi:hypothetical protein
VDDPKAWSFVLQWAEDKITFPTLSDMMTDTFGDQYVPSEWKLIFDRVFALSEDGDTGLAVAFILEEMDSRGVASSSGSRGTVTPPVETTGNGKRKAIGRPKEFRSEKRKRFTANRFLDVEAQDDSEEECSEGGEGEEDGSPSSFESFYNKFIFCKRLHCSRRRHRATTPQNLADTNLSSTRACWDFQIFGGGRCHSESIYARVR